MEATGPSDKVRKAKEKILGLFQDGVVDVAYDRELRYRLEDSLPHDVVAAAIKELVGNGTLIPTNVPGRRKSSNEHPNKFYRLPSSDYGRILPTMKKKLDLSAFVSGVSRDMGRHAELLWWRAFSRSGWSLHPEREDEGFGVRKYGEREASIANDIDFIAEKDGVTYGVEVKNSLGYPTDLFWKFTVAAELNTVPLIIARWLNPAQVPLIKELGGESVIYRDALYSSTYESLIKEVRSCLGAHIIPLDEIEDDYFARKVEPVHNLVRSEITERTSKLQGYLLRRRTETRVRIVLGAQTG